MKKNAFTLIELLAVIVILAIIALIAVPIVIHIINASKKSSEEQSLELYRDSVQKAIAKYQMTHPSFNPSECGITGSGDINCDSVNIPVDMKGIKPTKGLITIKNNKVSLRNVTLDGKRYYSVAKLLSDADNDGKVSIGDKYEYKVNSTDTFNFYVLSFNTDDTVNLIMDRNVCNDGTANYANSNSYCRYKWYSLEKNNTYGPVTAMQELYNATKNWDNVRAMELNYQDEANIEVQDNGYTSLVVSNGVGIITGKPITKTTTIGTNLKPLKARLPKYSELHGAGCTGSYGTCPIWLIEYMTYWNGANDKYSMNNNSETYQNQIYGYWLLSSYPGTSTRARGVHYVGRFVEYGTTAGGYYGIRPVITVSIDELSN